MIITPYQLSYLMKNKGNSALPDVRLAKVFNFTSEDLAANRLGFITREQRWNVPRVLRPVTRYLFSFLPARQRDSVSHICGKIRLNSANLVTQKSSWTYTLGISGYTLFIQLNAEQYYTLLPYEDTLHHIYYIFQFDNSRIVAIERVNKDW